MAEAQSIFIPKVSPGDLAALDYWTPSDAVFATSNGAEKRSALPILAYPDDEDRGYAFMGSMGEDYGGGIITFDIYWIAETAVAGDVKWQIFVVPLGVGVDFDAPTPGASKTVLSPAPATNGNIQKATIMFSNAEAGGISPGDPYIFALGRLATDSEDTMLGDAQFFRVNMKALP
jgi:hypothetical protein